MIIPYSVCIKMGINNHKIFVFIAKTSVIFQFFKPLRVDFFAPSEESLKRMMQVYNYNLIKVY